MTAKNKFWTWVRPNYSHFDNLVIAKVTLCFRLTLNMVYYWHIKPIETKELNTKKDAYAKSNNKSYLS